MIFELVDLLAGVALVLCHCIVRVLRPAMVVLDMAPGVGAEQQLLVVPEEGRQLSVEGHEAGVHQCQSPVELDLLLFDVCLEDEWCWSSAIVLDIPAF